MKLILNLVFVLAVLGSTRSHFLTKEDVAERLCHQDSRCLEGAKRCLEAIKPTDQELKRIGAAFESCVTSLGMENIVADFHNSSLSDSGVAHDHDANRETLYMYLPFIKFVEKRDATAATNFRCCFGRATHSLDKNKNINKEYFKSKITQKVTENKDALEALLSAVDACSPQTFKCDGHKFRVCFVEMCSKTIRV